MIGRRVQSIAEIEQPGDYFGPTTAYTSELAPAVFFLKPNARDENAPRRARSVQHACSPPHTFTEHPDGSLSIQPSIGAYVRDAPHTPEFCDGWHGFLDEGHSWRKVGDS
jgi:hypothetical protein